MPDELTPFAVELITRCPHLINLFADKINRTLSDWGMERLEPIIPKIKDYPETQELIMQELISHVGYTPQQCGYDK